MTIRRAPRAWVVGTLLRQGMPPGEIRAVLAADDPELAHRYIELHDERLGERLTEQRRALAAVAQALTAEVPPPRAPRARPRRRTPRLGPRGRLHQARR